MVLMMRHSSWMLVVRQLPRWPLFLDQPPGHGVVFATNKFGIVERSQSIGPDPVKEHPVCIDMQVWRCSKAANDGGDKILD